MWATRAGWAEALSGDIGMSASAAVWLGGDVTVPDVEIVGGSVRSELAGDQVQTRVTLRMADPFGELFTAAPGGAVGAEGHRLRLTSTVSAGRWSEMVPVGTLRINDVGVDAAAPWMLYVKSGRWVRGAQVLTVAAGDLLDQVADERFLAPIAPRSGATIASEVRRLLAGIVPVGESVNTLTRTVPSSIIYDEHDRLGALVDLLGVDGFVPWVDRDGVMQAVAATGSGDEWTVPMDAIVSVTPSVSRADLRNGWVVTSESETREALRGQATEGSGPLEWGGPFGRVPEFAHRPILRTNSSCSTAARTMRAKSIAGRRQVLTVTCGADPAVDVLDTAILRLPSGDVPGLVLATERDLLGRGMTAQVSVEWGALHV